MRGFYTRAIAPLPPLLLLLLVFLTYAGHAHAWSFSNVAWSIEKLLQAQKERGPRVADTNGGASAAVDGNGQDVTVQGRIIMVPRRSMGQCQPGQQLDRRGKCRTVW